MDFDYFLRNYGYLAVFVGALMEGESIVLLAGILASQGYMHPLGVVLAAITGSVTSDQLMFFLGRYKGPAILGRFPRIGKAVNSIGKRVEGHEISLILTFRFLYGLRNATPIFLGIHGTEPRLYIPLNILGAVIWAFIITYAGYYFGHLLDSMFAGSKYYHLIILGTVLIISLIAILAHKCCRGAAAKYQDRRRARKAERVAASAIPEQRL